MARPSYEHIGRAIADVRNQAKITQTHLAERLRADGWTAVDQSRLSKWERGVEAPNEIDYYPAIERICGATRGTILRRAGYVAENEGEIDIPAAIMADERLSEITRHVLADAYASALRRSSGRAPAAT